MTSDTSLSCLPPHAAQLDDMGDLDLDTIPSDDADQDWNPAAGKRRR